MWGGGDGWPRGRIPFQRANKRDTEILCTSPLHVSPLLFPFHPPLFVARSNVLGKMAKTKSRAMGEKNGARPHIPSNTKRMRKANGWIYIGNRFVA
jgi:hypothetical protein